MTHQILAVDLGGTNGRFGLFESDAGELVLKSHIWIPTSEVTSFEQQLSRAGEALGLGAGFSEVDALSIAVAGPVRDRYFCQPTWIPWAVDLKALSKPVQVQRAAVINDFLGQAYATRSIVADGADIIIPGEADSGGAVAVVGAGTGFGKAFLIQTAPGNFRACPSEGGHSNICPETEEEFRFFLFAKRELGIPYPNWDDIVCGDGLTLIHLFLTGERLPPKEVAQAFPNHPQTLEWISRLYGRVCRNFALEVLSTGGLYIAGGIAAKNRGIVEGEVFRSEFQNPRSHKPILEKIPVWLFDDEQSGLWGAAVYGQSLLRE